MKQMCRESKLTSYQETFAKVLAQKSGGFFKNGAAHDVKPAEQEGEDMRALAYSDDLPMDLVA